MTDDRLIPQTAPWYDRLATLQHGYAYPWRSHLGAWHGEDAYLALVRQHLRPDLDVLDVACGHGEVSIEIAPLTTSVASGSGSVYLDQRTASSSAPSTSTSSWTSCRRPRASSTSAAGPAATPSGWPSKDIA